MIFFYIFCLMIIKFHFFLDVGPCNSLPMYLVTRRHILDKSSLRAYVLKNKTFWYRFNKSVWFLPATDIQ